MSPLLRFRLTSAAENHNERGRDRLGVSQLDYGIMGRRLGMILIPAHRFASTVLSFGVFSGHAMVLSIHHPPWDIAIDPDILQRRDFNLPPPRNPETAARRCVHPCSLAVLLGPPSTSHVPVLALVSSNDFWKRA